VLQDRLRIEDLPEIDMHGEAFLADPYAVFADLQARTPVARSRRGLEVIDYAWSLELVSDRRFAPTGAELIRAKGPPPNLLAFLEDGFLLGIKGERHELIRRVIMKGFTIQRVEQQREIMRKVAGELIDRIAAAGEADAVKDFTVHFPTYSICRLMGVPDEDIYRFRDAGLILHLLGAQPIAPGFPKIEAALTVLGDYVAELVARRRAEPGPDFVSALIAAQETEGQLTESELVWNIANLLFAGQDTTRFQLASIIRALVEFSAWETLAEDPGRIPDAIAEGMRLYPSGQWNIRLAMEDLEYRGLSLKTGARVFLNGLASTRDRKVFPHPERFDMDRTERFALGFGRGPHNCVGQVLARTGMEEALSVLTTRLTDVAFAGPMQLAKFNAMVGGPQSLPIRFRTRA
jgi:cytochrome P450